MPCVGSSFIAAYSCMSALAACKRGGQPLPSAAFASTWHWDIASAAAACPARTSCSDQTPSMAYWPSRALWPDDDLAVHACCRFVTAAAAAKLQWPLPIIGSLTMHHVFLPWPSCCSASHPAEDARPCKPPWVEVLLASTPFSARVVMCSWHSTHLFWRAVVFTAWLLSADFWEVRQETSRHDIGSEPKTCYAQ